jgi:aspartate aminotransferase
MGQPQKLSDFVEQMGESATLKMAQKARDLTARGKKIINLSLGEPDFDTPRHIIDAAVQALHDGYTKYSPVSGLQVLKEAIQTKFLRDNDLHYDLDQIVVSNGAKQSLANVMLALLNPGDEVLVFSPYWVSYYEMIAMTGAKSVLIHATIENEFKVTAAQVEEAITPKTRMILYSSPCNPTGAAFNRAELSAFAEVLQQHPDIIVVSDEIYEYILFEGTHTSIGALPGMLDRTITVNGFAKGFAMTGWRLGYMGAPKWIAAACTKIQGQFTSGANSFGQVAGAHALLSSLEPTFAMRDQFQKRRDLVYKELSAMPGWKVSLPTGAFYLFPDVSAFFGKESPGGTICDANDFTEFILEHAQVAMVSGSSFGSDNCVRISYAASESQLIAAMNQIQKATTLLL